MKEMFRIREIIVMFYKKNEIWINTLVKFLLGLLIFTLINKLGNIDSFNKFPIVILMGILTAVLPISLTSFLMIVMICSQLLFVSLELALIVTIVLMCFLLFYVRIFPKESLLIFALVLAYYFKVPYAVVFVGAMFFGFLSIVPIAIGTFLWYSIPIVNSIASSGGTTIEGLASMDLLDIPNGFAKDYIYILDSMKTDQTWVISIIVFVLVIVLIYIISHLEVDYSNYLAIGVGSVVNIIGLMLSTLVAEVDLNMGVMIISTLFSAIIVCIIQFFTRVLDYRLTEKVQFEDEEYYYYVKLIPKVSSLKSKKN